MPDQESRGRSLFQRLAFRIPAVYLVLYGLPLLVSAIPWGGYFSNWWYLRTEVVGRWLILNVLNLPEHNSPPFTDRLSELLYCFLLLGVSLAVALSWSLMRRKDDTGLLEWLRTLVRLSLAAEMFVYGWSKLMPYQFWGGQVPLFTIASPLGQLSPHELLWAMMGYSRPYAVFAGAAEWVGALLLCFRRTATLGALIMVGALSNVVMLNFAFDVGVKVHATNLLLMALFIAAPDVRRLLSLLVLKSPVSPRPEEPLFRGKAIERGATAGAILLAALLALVPFSRMLPDLRAARHLPPLYGILEVDNFSRNGVTLPPLAGDSVRWRRIVFERYGRAVLTFMSDSAIPYRSQIDTLARTITLSPTSVRGIIIPKRPGTLRFEYAQPDKDHLIVRGKAGADSLTASLHYVARSSYFLLTSRHRWAW